MIIVRVELHSAITGQRFELARMHIANDGHGSAELGNYVAQTLRGRSSTDLDRGRVQREGRIKGHARLKLHVWYLVARALASCGYWKPLGGLRTTPAGDHPSDGSTPI